MTQQGYGTCKSAYKHGDIKCPCRDCAKITIPNGKKYQGLHQKYSTCKHQGESHVSHLTTGGDVDCCRNDGRDRTPVHIELIVVQRKINACFNPGSFRWIIGIIQCKQARIGLDWQMQVSFEEGLCESSIIIGGRLPVVPSTGTDKPGVEEEH